MHRYIWVFVVQFIVIIEFFLVSSNGLGNSYTYIISIVVIGVILIILIITIVTTARACNRNCSTSCSKTTSKQKTGSKKKIDNNATKTTAMVETQSSAAVKLDKNSDDLRILLIYQAWSRFDGIYIGHFCALAWTTWRKPQNLPNQWSCKLYEGKLKLHPSLPSHPLTLLAQVVVPPHHVPPLLHHALPHHLQLHLQSVSTRVMQKLISLTEYCCLIALRFPHIDLVEESKKIAADLDEILSELQNEVNSITK